MLYAAMYVIGPCTGCDTGTCASTTDGNGVCICLDPGTQCVGICEGTLMALDSGSQSCEGKKRLSVSSLHSRVHGVVVLQSVGTTCMATDVTRCATVVMESVIQLRAACAMMDTKESIVIQVYIHIFVCICGYL